MFLTKKKVISALILGGAGATVAVLYSLKGSEEIVINVEEHEDVAINRRAQKIVDEIPEPHSAGVF